MGEAAGGREGLEGEVLKCSRLRNKDEEFWNFLGKWE